MTSETAEQFVKRALRYYNGATPSEIAYCLGISVEDADRLFDLARRGAAMQTLGAHEFDPDPFFPTHCKCGRRFENNVHDLPPPPKGAEE